MATGTFKMAFSLLMPCSRGGRLKPHRALWTLKVVNIDCMSSSSLGRSEGLMAKVATVGFKSSHVFCD
jgi:hypothetical protein